MGLDGEKGWGSFYSRVMGRENLSVSIGPWSGCGHVCEGGVVVNWSARTERC